MKHLFLILGLCLFVPFSLSSNATEKQYLISKRDGASKQLCPDKMSEQQIRDFYERLIEEDQQYRKEQEESPGFKGYYVWEKINLIVKDPFWGAPYMKIDFSRFEDIETGPYDTIYQGPHRLLLHWSCLYKLAR